MHRYFVFNHEVHEWTRIKKFIRKLLNHRMPEDNNNRMTKKIAKWTMVMAIGTCVMALGTLLYFWKMTTTVNKMAESNNLLHQSLELSRQELELQYRPAIYLDEITLASAKTPDSIRLEFCFKNFGRVAGKEVLFDIDITEKRKHPKKLILYTRSIEGICAPQRKRCCNEKASLKELKEGLFAHIFVSYTGVSEASEDEKNYYNLMGNIKIAINEYQKLYHVDLDWDEKHMKGSLPDSVVLLYYKEKGVEMGIFGEDGEIEWL